MSTDVQERPSSNAKPRKGNFVKKTVYVVVPGSDWAVTDAAGVTKLTRRPDDWSPKLNKLFKPKDFVDLGSYYDFFASIFDDRAASCRKKAENARLPGGGVDKNEKKLRTQLERLQKEMARLRGEGYDVDAIFNQMVANGSAPADAGAPPATN